MEIELLPKETLSPNNKETLSPNNLDFKVRNSFVERTLRVSAFTRRLWDWLCPVTY